MAQNGPVLAEDEYVTLPAEFRRAVEAASRKRLALSNKSLDRQLTGEKCVLALKGIYPRMIEVLSEQGRGCEDIGMVAFTYNDFWSRIEGRHCARNSKQEDETLSGRTAGPGDVVKLSRFQ